MIFPYEGNKNVLRSLILPGWGELSMSHNSRAKIFFASEILILGTHLLGSSFNNWYIDEYTGFGELHANANLDGKDYSFIINMSFYNS